MSHELRTPLNAILGYTELIQDNIYGDVPDKDSRANEATGQEWPPSLGLINDVLDLSKIEAGLLTLSPRDYSVQEVVQSVIAALGSLATEKKLALKVKIPSDLPHAKGDDRRIAQVLLNLAGNAIKFTEAGEVRIEAVSSPEELMLSVADTRPGISAADQARIFEEFQQAEGSSTQQEGRDRTWLVDRQAHRRAARHGPASGWNLSPGTAQPSSSLYQSPPTAIWGRDEQDTGRRGSRTTGVSCASFSPAPGSTSSSHQR